MRPAALPALLLATVITLAACSDDATNVTAGGGGDTTTTSEPATAGTGNALVLQIHTAGGFVPAEYAFASLPEFTLYADGRIIVAGPTTLEFPGAATPNLLTGRVDAAAVRSAVDAAKDAGVTASPDLGQPGVADAPTTTFVLMDGGRTSTLDAYALDIGEGPGLTTAQQTARQHLEDLKQRMAKLGEAAEEPYRAAAVSVLATPSPEPEPGSEPVEPAPDEADWPLGDLRSGGQTQFGGRCLGFTGAEAEQVLAVAANARSNTRWRSDGATWSLALRPELPGTQPCAAG